MTETPENTQATDANAKPSMALRAQYIKDLSFENPRAPASLFGLKEAPQMEVSINLGAQKLDENVVELAMQISVRAIAEKTTIFLTDIVYAGVLELRNIPEAQQEQAIFIAGAQLVYPFARRVVADVTRDGGFPSLQLEPIDFAQMYAERRSRNAA
ncbi:MAG: protein-export chaperone SecB [Azospirillum brasilense]|nr:MAG: protein-export chaperone SecB [Azospirillum brasilense]